MDKKVCTRCKKDRLVKHFRVRKKGNSTWLNNTCRKCDAELANIYYNSKKSDPDFAQKNRDRVNKYRVENYDVVLQKERRRKKTSEYKQYMKNYREKNSVKIRNQHRVVSARWAKKQRNEITDQYVFQLLCHPRDGIDRDQVKKYPELIKYFKSHIKFKRLCKSKTSAN